MENQLLGTHQSTYDAIFQHPVSRNLQWRDVRAMLTSLADVTEESGGGLKFKRNGQTLTVHPPRRKDFSDIEVIMQIRHFLQHSGAPSKEPAAEVGTHLLVVIDHREARIYRTELHGSVPQRIKPYDPFGFGRDLHYNQDDSNGQRKPELKSFYEAVAKTLENARQIVMFGTGTGASSAMEQLLRDLKKNHPDVAKRVIGSAAVDEHHLTEDQLLAKAREFFVAA
jgi:hypothetical protein